MAEAVTKGLSAGDANPRVLGKGGSLLGAEELDTLPDDCVFSSLVMVSSDGSLPELLCLRRLLIGPWKSFGDVCRERLRGV